MGFLRDPLDEPQIPNIWVCGKLGSTFTGVSKLIILPGIWTENFGFLGPTRSTCISIATPPSGFPGDDTK